MVYEEYLHLRGFRKFLRSVPEIEWPRHSYILKNGRFFRRILLALVRWQPLAILLPAAKLEIFSLCLSQALLKNRVPQKSKLAVGWARLNRLHSIDEAHHIPFDFDLLLEQHKGLNFWRRAQLHTATLLFILVFQFVLISGFIQIFKRSLPELKGPKLWIWGPRGVVWGVTQFGPSIQTRRRLRLHFESKKLPYGKLFSFMHW
jgi:predicted metal-dependent hydrolase